jgi:hypothetical protein
VSPATTSVRRIAIASFVGTAIEFYDCLVSVALLRETKDADFTDGLEVPRAS